MTDTRTGTAMPVLQTNEAVELPHDIACHAAHACEQHPQSAQPIIAAAAAAVTATRPSCDEEDRFVPVVDVFTLQALTLRPHSAMNRVAEWCAAQRAVHRQELPLYQATQPQAQPTLPPSYDASMGAMGGTASFTAVPPLLYNTLASGSGGGGVPPSQQQQEQQQQQQQNGSVLIQPMQSCVQQTQQQQQGSTQGTAEGDVVHATDKRMNSNHNHVAEAEGEQDHTVKSVAVADALHVRVDTEAEADKDSTAASLPQTRKPRKSARPVRRKNEELSGHASAAAQLQTLHARLLLSVDSQRRAGTASAHTTEGRDAASHALTDHHHHNNNNDNNGDDEENHTSAAATTRSGAMTEPASAPLHACCQPEAASHTRTSTTVNASSYQHHAVRYPYDHLCADNSPAYAASAMPGHTAHGAPVADSGDSNNERLLAMPALSLPHSCSSATAEDERGSASGRTTNTSATQARRLAMMQRANDEPQQQQQLPPAYNTQVVLQVQQEEEGVSGHSAMPPALPSSLGLVATFSDFRAHMLQRWPPVQQQQQQVQAPQPQHQDGVFASNGVCDASQHHYRQYHTRAAATSSNNNNISNSNGGGAANGVPVQSSRAGLPSCHGLTSVCMQAEAEHAYGGARSTNSNGVVHSRRNSAASSRTLNGTHSRPLSPSFAEHNSLPFVHAIAEAESAPMAMNACGAIAAEKDHPLSRPPSYGAANHTCNSLAPLPLYNTNSTPSNTNGGATMMMMMGSHDGSVAAYSPTTTMTSAHVNSPVVVPVTATAAAAAAAAAAGAKSNTTTALQGLRVSQPWVLVATDWLDDRTYNNDTNTAGTTTTTQSAKGAPQLIAVNQEAPFSLCSAASSPCPQAQPESSEGMTHVHQLLTSQLYDLLRGWNWLTSHVTAASMTCEADVMQDKADGEANKEGRNACAGEESSSNNTKDIGAGTSTLLHPRVLSSSVAAFIPMSIDRSTPHHHHSHTQALSTQASPRTSITSTAILSPTANDTTQPHAEDEGTAKAAAAAAVASQHERTESMLTTHHDTISCHEDVTRVASLCPYRSMGVYPYGLAYAVTQAATAHPCPAGCNTQPVEPQQGQQQGNVEGPHLPGHDSALHATQPYFSPLMSPSAAAVPSALPDMAHERNARNGVPDKTAEQHEGDDGGCCSSRGDVLFEYFRAKACVRIRITQEPHSRADNLKEGGAHDEGEDKTRYFARAARLARDLQHFASTGAMTSSALKAQLNDAFMGLLTRTPCFATCLRPSTEGNDGDDEEEGDDVDDEAEECMTSCATSSISLRASRWPERQGMVMNGLLPSRPVPPWRVTMCGPFMSPRTHTTQATQPPSYVTPLALHITTHVLPTSPVTCSGDDAACEEQEVQLCVTVLARRARQAMSNASLPASSSSSSMREAAFAALTTLFPASFILSAQTTQIAFSHCALQDGLVQMQPFEPLPLPALPQVVQPHVVMSPEAAARHATQSELSSLQQTNTTEEERHMHARMTESTEQPACVRVTSEDTAAVPVTVDEVIVEEQQELQVENAAQETSATTQSPVDESTQRAAVAEAAPPEEEEEQATAAAAVVDNSDGVQSVTEWAGDVSEGVRRATQAWLRLRTHWDDVQRALRATTTAQLLADYSTTSSNNSSSTSSPKRRTAGGNGRGTAQPGIAAEAVLEPYVQLLRDDVLGRQLLTLVASVTAVNGTSGSNNNNSKAEEQLHASCAASLAMCTTQAELTQWLREQLVQPVQSLEDTLQEAHALQHDRTATDISTSAAQPALAGSTSECASRFANNVKPARRTSVVGAQLAVGKNAQKGSVTSQARAGERERTGTKGSHQNTHSAAVLPALRVLLRLVQPQLQPKDKARGGGGSSNSNSNAATRKREANTPVVVLSAEAVETLWQEAVSAAKGYTVHSTHSQIDGFTHARDGLVSQVERVAQVLECRAGQVHVLHHTMWEQGLLPFLQERAGIVQDCVRGYEALRVQYERSLKQPSTAVHANSKAARKAEKHKGTNTNSNISKEDTDTMSKDAQGLEQLTQANTAAGAATKNVTSRTTSIGGETQATTSNTPRAETHSTELELTQHSMVMMTVMSAGPALTSSVNESTAGHETADHSSAAAAGETMSSSDHTRTGMKEKAVHALSLPEAEKSATSATTSTQAVNSPRHTPREMPSLLSDVLATQHSKTASVATTATLSTRSTEAVGKQQASRTAGGQHKGASSTDRRGAAHHAPSLSSSITTTTTIATTTSTTAMMNNSSMRRTRNENKAGELSAVSQRTGNNSSMSAPSRRTLEKTKTANNNNTSSSSSAAKGAGHVSRLGELRIAVQDRTMAKISIVFVLCGACILAALFLF